MKFIALKELPNGTQPNQPFEATEAQGNVLVLVGAARLVEEEPSVDEPPAERPSRRTYRRRDLEAETESQ